ncbi:MAG: Fic family protein, partial [Oscillospiraceae bacterium]
GNTLTLRETALILQEGITIAEKSIKEHLEVIGHKDALEYVIRLTDKSEPLTQRVIKDIHSLVLMNDNLNRGVYRNVPVQILGALHTPPQPYLIAKQMEELLLNYPVWKENANTIECVSHFHIEFESIHPFIDGNGRTGRLILNFELMKAGLLPVNIKFSDRKNYYNCFDFYYENNKDVSMFSNLVADYEIAELTKYIKIIKGEY